MPIELREIRSHSQENRLPEHFIRRDARITYLCHHNRLDPCTYFFVQQLTDDLRRTLKLRNTSNDLEDLFHRIVIEPCSNFSPIIKFFPNTFGEMKRTKCF